MIGIYKITNKLDGKSYIGQSIHCGKRLDEHCKGNQFIDEVIQLEGIENFTFEILKEVNREELSEWEDFYIMKYNTMFPNGYNKRWNCPKKQVIIKKKESKQEQQTKYFNGIELIRVPKLAVQNSPKLSNNQWGVYYYLLLFSNYNQNQKRNYIYKADISPTKIAKFFGFQTRSYYNIINTLIKKGLLIDESEALYFSSSEKYTAISRQQFSNLLFCSENLSIDLLRTYLACKTIFEEYGLIKSFSIRKMVEYLGHSVGRSEQYKIVESCLDFLIQKDLIKINTKQKEKSQSYQIYNINDKYLNNFN